MGRASLDRVVRKAMRVERIVDVAEKTAVKVAGSAVKESKVVFEEAIKEVQRITTIEGKEREEGDEASTELGNVYDTIRSSTLVKQPYADLAGRASCFTTTDDLLAGAVKLEDHLARVAGVDGDHPMDGADEKAPIGEEWALLLLKELVSTVEKARKEHVEAVRAGEDLQKAKDSRARNRGILEERIMSFRWVVRDAYGVHSKEYHSLRDRKAAEEDEEELEEGSKETGSAEEPKKDLLPVIK